MFIPKAFIERLFAAVQGHGAASAEVAALRAENARLQASCDWLAQHVSELKAERQILFERVLEISIPLFSVERDQPVKREAPRDVPERGIPADLTPEKLREMGRYIAPMGDRGQVYQPTTGELEAQAAMAIFEDVGDARAKELGLETPDLVSQ